MLNVSTRLLPLNSLIWNGETEIIAAGHVSPSISVPCYFY
jgi:hypothetical protein